MRIRKRQVPLPFSSISPLSDPNFNLPPPLTVVQLPLRQQQPPLPESDHPNQPIGQPLSTQARDSSALHGTTTTTAHEGEQLMKNTQDHLALKSGGEDEEKKNNDTRKKNVLGAKLGSGSSSSSHYQAIGRWGEREKAFPLKKRRVDEDDDDDDDYTIITKEASNKRLMKSNGSKNIGDNDNDNANNGAKKRGRGGALMEGSRCSRVNGRGWRCCQQTLVGYSLCEHHLGKGRLRSISSVRNRAKEERRQGNNIGDQYQGTISSSQQLGEEHKPLMMRKKRMKLGIVKARSMSSLMGQNDNAIAIVDESS